MAARCRDNTLVMPRESGASSTPRPIDSIADASGILDLSPSRAMTIRRCSLAHEGAPERHDLIAGVVSNIGTAQPGNARLPAPVAGDFLFVHAKVRIVRRDVAATAQHDAGSPPDPGLPVM